MVRNPYSTRPYQHVLEPLYAYLMIAAKQYKHKKYAGYYNVGPDDQDCVQTGALVDLFVKYWGDCMKWVNQYDGGPHEANFLKLDCSKLKTTFGWKPHWNLDKAIEEVRSVEMQDGRMSLNARPVTLRVREVPAAITENEIAALREQGFNTLKLLPGPVPESLLNFCDVQGLYVIAQAPIDTRRSGESRRKGGNPSNDPEWQPAYLERTENSYHTTKRHPSVVAFALATQSANGINLYESYLNMKRFGDSRPFIYPDAGGEWDSDKLALE